MDERVLVGALSQPDSKFLAVASELVVLVFEQLYFKDVLACRRACSYFKDVIDSSQSLQYKLDLANANLTDCFPPHVDTASKQKQLQCFQTARNTFLPRDTRVIEIPSRLNAMFWIFAGEVALYQLYGEMHFVRISSKCRNIDDDHWSYRIDRGWEVLCEDFDQNVVAFIGDRDESFWDIHILQYTGGDGHDLAQNTVLPYKAPVNFSPTLANNGTPNSSGCLCGIYMALLMVDEETKTYTFTVVDWTISASVLRKSGLGCPCFAFLDHEHILFTTSDPPSLEVFKFEAGGTLGKNTGHSLTLHLPICKPEGIVRMSIVCDDPSAKSSTASTERPYSQSPAFRVLRDDRLIIISVVMEEYVETLERWVEEDLRLLVLASTLVRKLHQQPPGPHHEGWDAFWEKNTRVIAQPLTPPWSCGYGCRYITTSKGCAVIHDYYPYGLQRSIFDQMEKLGEEETLAMGHLYCDETVVSRHYLSQDMKSSLPFREYITPVPVGKTESVALTESSIVVCKNPGMNVEIGMKIFTV